MIFGKFINKTNKYLKSVRILKNYVSFDMVLPTSWVNEKNLIDLLENTMDNIIKTNIEREEKERLFKSKVQELKSIFEKENLENLKGLKFDIEELTKLMEDETTQIDIRVAEATENAE